MPEWAKKTGMMILQLKQGLIRALFQNTPGIYGSAMNSNLISAATAAVCNRGSCCYTGLGKWNPWPVPGSVVVALTIAIAEAFSVSLASSTGADIAAASVVATAAGIAASSVVATTASIAASGVVATTAYIAAVSVVATAASITAARVSTTTSPITTITSTSTKS